MADVKVETPQEKQARVFRDYIKHRKTVIIDSQSYTRAALAGTLTELGASMASIALASNFEDGRAAIAETDPDIVFAEYDLQGGRCGLDLLVDRRNAAKNTPDPAAQAAAIEKAKRSLFFLVTGNNSQAAVARAAEEDVDGYILKPYTLDGLRGSIMRHALLKAYPSSYTRAIEEGKKLLGEEKSAEAKDAFDKAMRLDPKPALACFYHGQAELLNATLELVQKDYEKGLAFNKIHYKCLVGLFDLLMDQNRSREAYDVVRRISRYFPANPDRLATVLRLAVVNGAYEDIERYYQLFCKLDQRNEQLIRFVCAALVVCGKHYLQQKIPSRALELFSKARVTGLGRPKILREIIASLLTHDMAVEAESFLAAYPAEHMSSESYKALHYAVTEHALPLGTSVARGRELIRAGIKDPVLYLVLIERSVQAGYQDHAEELQKQACAAWPEQSKDFEKVLKHPRIRAG